MNELVEIISKSYVLYAMAGVFFLGIVSRFFLNMIYRSLYKDVGNMPTPRKKILKLIKLKYESCDKLDMQISNTEAFVKKNLYEYRVCGISLRAFEKILGQALFFGALIGVTATVFAMMVELESGVVFAHAATTILGAALLFNYDKLSDIAYKRRMVETGLVDFLENHLQMHFLAQERGEAAEKEGKIIDFAGSSKRFESDKEDLSEVSPESGIKSAAQSGENDSETENVVDDNRIIEEVLREFFG